MEIRGERECTDCGARWSYYETGSVECPDCGSLRSVGAEDERRLHTDAATPLDLSAAHVAAADGSLREAAEAAGDAAGEYVRKRGFVSGGELRPLDGTFLAAWELRHAASDISRAMTVGEDEERYLLALLNGAPDGEGPGPDEVPASLREARGLAAAAAVRDYRRDVSTWVDRHGADGAARRVLESLGDHVKRVRALDGAVSPADAERLVRAAQELGTYLREDDEAALDAARERLAALA